MNAQVVCHVRTGVTLSFNLKEKDAVMGRDTSVGISVPVEGVSRQHARIRWDGKAYWVEDLKSTNGTFVNGQATMNERLKHLDVISLGKEIDLIFLVREGAAPATRMGIVNAALVPRTADAPPIPIAAGEITLGRSPSCNVVLDSGAVSKVHARIERTLDQLVLEDLGSANGTFVNDEKVMTALLQDGDTLSLAEVDGYRIAIEMGEVKDFGSGQMAKPKLPEDRQRFSAEWKTRFEWDSGEREALEALRAQIRERERAREVAKGTTKPNPKAAAAKPAAPAAAKPAAPKPAAAAAAGAPAAAPTPAPATPAPAPAAVPKPGPAATPTPAPAAAKAEAKPPAAAPKPTAAPQAAPVAPAAAASPAPSAPAAKAPSPPTAEPFPATVAMPVPAPAPKTPAPPPTPVAKPPAPAAPPASIPAAAPSPPRPTPAAAAPAPPPAPARPASAAPPKAAPPVPSKPAVAPPPPAPARPAAEATPADDEPAPTVVGLGPTPTLRNMTPLPPGGRIMEIRLTAPNLELSAREPGAHELGRATEAPLRVNDPTVSRKHARVILADDRTIVYLQDAGGQNGTRLNGRAIEKLAPLTDGDRIGIGDVELKVAIKRG